jgi:hypothetical protein
MSGASIFPDSDRPEMDKGPRRSKEEKGEGEFQN